MQQVNLVGIIFSITSPAYALLKGYRLELYRYFVQQPDGEEILADLEHHIAEIFWETTQQNVITIDDAIVQDMIARMGEVADFEEAMQNPVYAFTYQESDEMLPQRQPSAEAEFPVRRKVAFAPYSDEVWNLPAKHTHLEKTDNSAEDTHEIHHQRLYRDTKRAVLGGVAAGFGYYFQVDTVWVRLACLMVGLGLIPKPFETSTAIFIYGLLWVALPKNQHLPELDRQKRLYRDLADRQVGGVCAGIARYFGWEKKKVRLAFGISAFTGVGILLYGIFWAIIPKKTKY